MQARFTRHGRTMPMLEHAPLVVSDRATEWWANYQNIGSDSSGGRIADYESELLVFSYL
jgi:hypothetical protein